MKHKIILAAIAATALGLNSCSEDFLDVESPDKLYIDEYFTTEDRIFESLVAAYDPLEWFDWGQGQYNPINIMSDIMADQIWVGGSDRTDNQAWHLMANYEAIPTNCISGIWVTGYSGVKRANDMISYMDGVTDISDENRALYLAEAKVLRAFYYTLIWKFWGNVPFYSTNLTYPYICEQSSADQVYAGIIADLDDAIANGGLPMKVASNADCGHVTLAMAYMLYAEVVMYQNDESNYGKALKYMEEIINSGQYALVDDFAAIWEESGEWSSESIWEINYKDDGAYRSWDYPLNTGGTVLPRLISMPKWVDGTDGFDGGWGFAPVRQETYDMYEDGDTRRDGTIYKATTEYTPRYEDTGLWLKKYLARSGYNADQIADADLNYNNNLRIYRYSETLLNAAELIARGASGSGSAQTYLDQVRDRAGVEHIDATVDNIIQERALEFVGEGKRYWDLVRTGKASQVLVPDALGYRTNTWSETKKYLPIPQTEINSANGTLKQNPGY